MVKSTNHFLQCNSWNITKRRIPSHKEETEDYQHNGDCQNCYSHLKLFTFQPIVVWLEQTLYLLDIGLLLRGGYSYYYQSAIKILIIYGFILLTLC